MNAGGQVGTSMRNDMETQKIKVDGRYRKYLLYEPDMVDKMLPVPLVISIHGLADWPARQAAMSRWNTLADEEGFLVVYPAGTGFPPHWNTGGIMNGKWSTEREVKFFQYLLDHLSKDYRIDTKRVYANGFSNGGGMAVLLAHFLPDRITAIGLVSAAITIQPKDFDPETTIPMILFHGTSDPIVPYHGGLPLLSRRSFPDIPDWTARLAEHFGCSPEGRELTKKGEVSSVVYSTCRQNAKIVLYSVNGGGHAWPGGKPLPFAMVGHTTLDIDATRLMWKFFQEFTG
jgi:polyhydroxybutyrate depolymerase